MVYGAEIACVKNALLWAFIQYTPDPNQEESASRS
jgi:hypothetical protein